MSGSPRGRRAAFWAVAGGSSVALTLWCYGHVLGYGFTDVDTLMYVVAARVEGLDDLLGQFAMKLTDGRAGDTANFYRPSVMLMFVGLRAAFGWEPIGYHAVDLFLHALCGLLLAEFLRACAQRAGIRRPGCFGVLSAAIFLIHPVGAENVPAVARNGDLLVTVCLLAALRLLVAVEDRHARGASLRALAVPLVFFNGVLALTLGAKEPGIVVLAIVPLYVLILRSDLPRAARVRHAGAVVLPGVFLAVGYLTARAFVLGETVGGYPTGNVFTGSEGASYGRMAWHLIRSAPVDFVLPGYAYVLNEYLPSLQRSSSLELAWVTGLVVALATGAWRAVVEYRRRYGSPGVALRSASALVARSLEVPSVRLLAFLAPVVVVYVAICFVTRSYGLRLLYAPIAFSSGILGLGVFGWFGLLHDLRGRWSTVRGTRRLWRCSIVVAACPVALLYVTQSPLVHRYDHWRSSGDATRLLTESMREEWELLPAGAHVYLINSIGSFRIPAEPRWWARGWIGAPRPRSAPSISWHGLQAWLDDQLPEQRVSVYQLGVRHYKKSVVEFRHECERRAGWLVCNVPESHLAYDLEVDITGFPQLTPEESATAFQAKWAGCNRVAVAYGAAPLPEKGYVLVFDGQRPLLTPLEGLTGGADRTLSDEQPRDCDTAEAG